MIILVCISTHCGLQTTLKLPHDAVMVSFVNLTQPRVIWEESVKEKLGWPVSMSLGVVFIKLTCVRRPGLL